MSPVLRAAVIILALLVSGQLSGANAASEQSADSLVILIVDMDKIRRKADAVQLLQREVDQRRTAYRNELQQREQELRSAGADLTRQRTILSAEAFTQRRKALEERAATMQQEAKERRRVIEALFKKGMGQVQKHLSKILGEIAKDREADVVLTKALVALVKPELEITQQALDRLNAELPEVALDAEQD